MQKIKNEIIYTDINEIIWMKEKWGIKFGFEINGIIYPIIEIGKEIITGEATFAISEGEGRFTILDFNQGLTNFFVLPESVEKYEIKIDDVLSISSVSERHEFCMKSLITIFVQGSKRKDEMIFKVSSSDISDKNRLADARIIYRNGISWMEPLGIRDA